MTTSPSATASNQRVTKPWYREPWPWILMSGPFAVIIASFISAWYAVTTSDGLVSDDYYKQGMAAGETLAKNRHAEELGIAASLRLKADSVTVRLTGPKADAAMPATLSVMLSHPTRAGLDQKSVLKRTGEAYTGVLHLPASGHWLVLIEDEAKTWRLMGSVVLPAANETVIGGEVAAAKPKS